MYNGDKYLRECLDSLTRQNFNSEQYEVIIVNDGSLDNTENIALEYCTKYGYFKLINQANGGVSVARNTGLSFAKGKYITFIDADDYVADDIYQPIINLMQDNSLEGFYFGYTNDKTKLEKFHPHFYFPKKENSCKMGVWRVIFLKQIIVDNKLIFSKDIKYCEDVLFNYKYIQALKKGMVGSAQCLYYNRLSPNSATGTFNSSNGNLVKTYYNSLKSACLEIKNYTNRHNIPKDNLYKTILSTLIVNLLWGCMRLKLNAKKIVSDLKTNGVYLNDITVKTASGNSVKYKFKSWLEFAFRYKIVFYLSCFIYKLIGK